MCGEGSVKFSLPPFRILNGIALSTPVQNIVAESINCFVINFIHFPYCVCRLKKKVTSSSILLYTYCRYENYQRKRSLNTCSTIWKKMNIDHHSCRYVLIYIVCKATFRGLFTVTIFTICKSCKFYVLITIINYDSIQCVITNYGIL